MSNVRSEHSPPPSARKKRDILSVLGMVAVAGAAAFTSYSGLSGLAELAGWPSKLALMLPITIDAYAMTATRVWLSPARLTKKARSWARGNAIGAISMSVLGNTIYHAASAHVLSVTWPVVVGISAIPSVVLGLTVHLWHVADDTEPEASQTTSAGKLGDSRVAVPEVGSVPYPVLGALPDGLHPRVSVNGISSVALPASTKRAASSKASSSAGVTRSGKSGTGSKAAPSRSTDARTLDQLMALAREVNDQSVSETGRPASVARLKVKVGVGQGKAQQLRDALALPGQSEFVIPDQTANPTPALSLANSGDLPPTLPEQRAEAAEQVEVGLPVEHANGQQRSSE